MATPSFNCANATYPDETAICSSTELSQLDTVLVAGYEYVRRRYGDQYAKSINAPLFQARRACGPDVACIKERQLAAIKVFEGIGAPIVATNNQPTQDSPPVAQSPNVTPRSGALPQQLPVTAQQPNFEESKQSTQDAPVTDCDTHAASDQDPQRKVTGVPFANVNPALAVPACEEAVRQYPNSTRLSFQLGRAYQKANNFTAALQQFRKAAEQNYAVAQTSLGFMYANGQGVPRDEMLATTWYRKAADQGLAVAQYNLGVIYEKGQGVPQDSMQAVAWYRRAADVGFAPAQANLARLSQAVAQQGQTGYPGPRIPPGPMAGGQSPSAPPCPVATPGPGFPVSGGKIVITREAFDISTDVEGAIKATFGNDATIADWQTLKRLLSTQTELSDFIEQVGIPRQTQNGPCDNFLVRNGGSFRLANGYWLFIARHDGRVPANWAVLDSIGNHTLDLGRWNHNSQALVFIPDNIGAPPSASPAGNADASKRAAEEEAQRKTAEAEAAQRSADESAKKAVEAEAARAAAAEQAQRKTAEAEAYKRQIEEQQRQQKLIFISTAAFLVLIGTAVAIVFIVRRKITINPVIGAATPTKDEAERPAPTEATEASLIKDEAERPTPTEATEASLIKDEAERPTPTEGTYLVDQLAKFAELRADGTLTEAEFEELKAKLLGTSPKKSSQSDYIKQLRAMRDKGDLTEDEFQSRVLESLSEVRRE